MGSPCDIRIPTSIFVGGQTAGPMPAAVSICIAHSRVASPFMMSLFQMPMMRRSEAVSSAVIARHQKIKELCGAVTGTTKTKETPHTSHLCLMWSSAVSGAANNFGVLRPRFRARPHVPPP